VTFENVDLLALANLVEGHFIITFCSHISLRF
jgi:hypothetical protein